jgi:uncharacterized protein involved in type VI secretion and phage assembly
MARLTDRDGKPVSGMQQNGVVGIVTDNVDPDELGRIQVKFPTLHGEPLSFWLRQIAPMAGKERGLYALPEKDDEVLVMFMQGSQDTGVIVGQFWNGVDIPPQECKDGMPVPGDTVALERSTDEFNDGSKDLAANDRRFWKSRSGHLIVMDDTGGAETVQIWDQTHTLALVFDSTDSRILLTNSKGDIHIRTETDLYLEAGNDIIVTAKNNLDTLVHNDMITNVDMNITTEAGMEISEKAGTDFTQEAGMNWKAKGGMNWTGEAGVAALMKGGVTAEVNGAASTTIKGGIVMIN